MTRNNPTTNYITTETSYDVTGLAYNDKGYTFSVTPLNGTCDGTGMSLPKITLPQTHNVTIKFEDKSGNALTSGVNVTFAGDVLTPNSSGEVYVTVVDGAVTSFLAGATGSYSFDHWNKVGRISTPEGFLHLHL